MWQLRVSVMGLSKSVAVPADGSIEDDVVAEVRRAFKVSESAEVVLSGGFPPRPLSGVVRDVTTNKALLRAVIKEEEKGAPSPAKKKPTKRKPAAAPSTRTKQRKMEATTTLDEALLSEEKSSGSLFLRSAMRAEMLSRLEERKAEDRYAASMSKCYEMSDVEHKLNGQVSKVEVSFAVDGSLGRKSKKRHVDQVEALGRDELVAAISGVYNSPDRDMLQPTNVARCSPRVFWALIRHSDGADIQTALEMLLPDLDWSATPDYRQEATSPQTRMLAEAANEETISTGEENVREIRAQAAEARTRGVVEKSPADLVVDRALLECVEQTSGAVELLRRANVTAPRDLALWKPCPDILAETIGIDDAPPVETLQRWAETAERMIAERPELKEYFAAPLVAGAT